eukprot:gene12410-20526_t
MGEDRLERGKRERKIGGKLALALGPLAGAKCKSQLATKMFSQWHPFLG